MWGRGREEVKGIFDSCFLIYCSLLGDFCSENIILKKMSSTEEASNENVAKKS